MATKTLSLTITADAAAKGTVSVPGLAFSQAFTVPASGTVTVTLPAGADLGVQRDLVQSRGVRVQADAEVAVYGVNASKFSTDAYLGLPTDALGKEYVVVSYNNEEYDGRIPAGSEPIPPRDDEHQSLTASGFVVVATQDDTEVTVKLSQAAGTRAKGVEYKVPLKAGETYQMLSDLTLGGGVVGAT